MKDGHMMYPDAQLDIEDSDGMGGRVNAEGARAAPWSSRPEVHGRTQGAEPMKLTRLF